MSEDSERTIKSNASSLTDSEATIRDDNGMRNRRLKAGDVLLGRYEVLSELGQGGMGVVYRCLDKTGGVEVAVKALPPELSHSSSEMEEVRDNYGLVSKLVHQNIAACRTLDMDPSTGDYYLVMEYVDGEPLKQWIRRMRKDGQLDLDKSLAILRQVADALDYAHSQKIMHRDIKPGNIMVKSDGTVKVLDFGLAAQIRSSLSHVSMAYASRSGTNLYKSPEQWRGQPQGAATDQYALAVTAYEMLSGHVPFEDDDPDVLRRAVLSEAPVRIDGIPDYANKALLQGLAKEISGRYATCTDFVKALGGGKGKTMGTASHGWLKLAVAAVLVLLLIVASAAYRRHAEAVRKEAEMRAAETARIKAERKVEAERKAEEERKTVEMARIEAEKKAEAEREAAEKAAKKAADELAARKTRRLELGADAEMKTKAMRERKLDRGQTFGKHLDELERQMAKASLAGDGDPSAAIESYDAALKEIAWLQENAPLREESLKVAKSVETARKEARKEGAEKHATDAFRKASDAEEDGLKACEDGDFKIALDKLAAAAEGFATGKAASVAKRLTIELAVAQKAIEEKNWEEAVAHAEAALNIDDGHAEAKKLKTEAEKAIGLAAELSASRKAFQDEKWADAIVHAENVLKLELAHEEAKKLKADAEANWPSICIKATINGQEVEAMLSGTDRKTPLVEKRLDAGKELKGQITFNKGNDEYVGAFDQTVDWRGCRDIVLELTEATTKTVALKNGVELELVKVKAGSFVMGSPSSERERKKNEIQHRVELTKDFWIGKYEITQAQWQTIIGTTQEEQLEKCALAVMEKYALAAQGITTVQLLTELKTYIKIADNCPVIYVNWQESMDFCRKLTDQERSAGRLPSGYEFTLPTEAQWEYAARGGHKSNGYHIYSGSDDIEVVGWYKGNSDSFIHPVGGKQANELGIYDMTGNVWEMCLDYCEIKKSLSITNTYKDGITDPNCHSGSNRLARGGSCVNDASDSRSAFRNGSTPSIRESGLGFRIVLVPVQ